MNTRILAPALLFTLAAASAQAAVGDPGTYRETTTMDSNGTTTRTLDTTRPDGASYRTTTTTDATGSTRDVKATGPMGGSYESTSGHSGDIVNGSAYHGVTVSGPSGAVSSTEHTSSWSGDTTTRETKHTVTTPDGATHTTWRTTTGTR
jgi:hypothetical protein